jgi:hypothetical protein
MHAEQPEGNALGRDGQRRVQIHPSTRLVVQRPEPGDALLGGVVELRGILDAQHPGMLAQALLGAGDMRGEHTLEGDLGMVEQTVGRFGLVPTPAGGGNAHRGLLSQGLQHLPSAVIQASIAQIDRAQLRGQGAHVLTPSAARKSPASG